MAKQPSPSITTAIALRLRNTLASRYFREPIILVLAYIPYFIARGLAVSHTGKAFQDARNVAHIEISLGIFKEISVQSATISYSLLLTSFNLIYFYGHWPVIIACGAYLFVKNPRVYGITRNAFLISGAAALLLYALYPVAPPRLSMDGIVDTLGMTVPISLDKSRLVNPYAALPSLHVGWDLLIALGLFLATRRWPIRFAVLLLPPVMLLATVVTGNHFFIDGIVGGSLAFVAFMLSMWLQRVWPGFQERVLQILQHTIYPVKA